MDSALLANALQFAAYSCIPLLAAIGIGALISGLLRVATQIDDAAIGFIGRFAGLSVFLLWASSGLFQRVFQYTLRMWSGADLYH